MITLNYDKHTRQANLMIDGLQSDVAEELANIVIDITEEFQGDDPLLDFIQVLVDYKNERDKKEVVM